MRLKLILIYKIAQLHQDPGNDEKVISKAPGLRVKLSVKSKVLTPNIFLAGMGMDKILPEVPAVVGLFYWFISGFSRCFFGFSS